MMKANNQEINVVNNEIYIHRSNFLRVASISYSEYLYERISKVLWYPSNCYLRSSLGYLHTFVMKVLLGEDVVTTAYKSKFVIDHLNNNGYDCRYQNLEIIPSSLNKSKGQDFDQEREKTTEQFAVNFSKDLSSGEYQISIAFNQPTNLNINEQEIPISVLYFRYSSDYRQTFHDAQSILNDLNKKSFVDISKLRTTAICYRKAFLTVAEGDEVKNGMLWRNGNFYFVQGSPGLLLTQAAHSVELHTQ